MNGGDTDTGGTQVDPRVVPPSSSGSQPVESAAPAAEDASVLTISHDQPSTSSPSRPASQSLPTPQPTPIPTPAPAPSPAPSVPPIPPVNTPTPQPLPVSPLPTPTALNPSTSTQPQVAPQPLQPAQPLSPSPLPPQQPASQFPTQPVFSNNSDVIIGSPAPQKSRKILLILLLIVILLVACGVILYFSLTSGNTKESARCGTPSSCFRMYSNYVVNGIEKEDVLEDYNIFTVQESSLNPTLFRNGKDDGPIDLAHAVELFEDFKNQYTPSSESAKMVIDDYYDNLLLFCSMIADGGFYMDTYLEKSAKLGLEEFEKMIDETYANYTSMASNHATKYATIRKELDESILAWMLSYDVDECFDDSHSFNAQECPYMENEEFSMIIENIMELRGAMAAVENDLIYDIWSIQLLIDRESYEG